MTDFAATETSSSSLLPPTSSSSPSPPGSLNPSDTEDILATSHDNIGDIFTPNGTVVFFKQNNQLTNGQENKNYNNDNLSLKPALVHDTGATTTTTKKPGFLGQFSGRTKYVLVLCCLANFLACCAFSLLAPFYPLEAERKGMSLTMIGFVFSVFQLVIFFVSPIIGSYLTKLGAKFVYISGIFVGGSCVILFGVLDKGPDGAPFIAISLVCRSVEALGIAAFTTASFAIISNECREAVGSAFALLETSAGMGFMIGPAIGGALYQLGGYGLPFYVMGCLILMNGILIYKALPKPEVTEKKRQGSMLSLLRSPMVVFSMSTVLIGQIGITVFDSTFAKHMETFGVSTVVIGLYFVIPPGLYAIVGPLWGYLTDHKNVPKFLLILGYIIFTIGYLFIGPSPLLPFLPNELWVIIIGLLLIGFSFGMLLIPAMKLMVDGAHELKFEASLDTYALISGLFNSVNSFGGFLGPMMGGAIVQEYGHQVGYTVVSFMSIFMLVVGCVYFCIRRMLGGEKGTMSEEGMHEKEDETSALIPGERSNSNGGNYCNPITRVPTERMNSSGSGKRFHLSLSRSLSIPNV